MWKPLFPVLLIALVLLSGCTQPTGQASLSSAQTKTDCPYECCKSVSQYFDKVCGVGEECIDQKCVEEKQAGQTSEENYIKDQCIQIPVGGFHYDAAGNDNYNLNDEYVQLKNNCNYQIEMTGWTIKDTTSRADHIYTLPSFTLNPSTSVTLHTGQGANTAKDLYWQRSPGDYAAIWNNTGDTLHLRNSEGELVSSYSYGS